MSRARRWVARGLALLVAVVLVHLLVVHSIPYLIMGVAIRGIANGGGMNTALFPPRADASSRGIVRPSPDLLYGVCAFDVRARPLRVRVEVPIDAYWSLSMFAADTDNFFVVNDRQAGGGTLVDLVLALPKTEVDLSSDAQLVEAPSARGIILTRTLVGRDERLPELDRARRTLTCEPL